MNYKDAGPDWKTSRKIVNSADMTSLTDITDAPDKKLVLTDLLISVDTAMNVTIKEETTGVILCGPIYLAANSTVQVTTRGEMSKTTTIGKKVQAIASAAGNITIEAWWYTEA